MQPQQKAPLFAPEHFGQYLLLSHLGRGGMADVYKARVDGVAGFSRAVVVKRILKVHTSEQHFVEMFINEAKIAARLSHPNIVQVYELGEVDGELFMAMEYVRGLDLLRLLRASAAQRGDAALPPAIGAYVIREVCRGLAHAHDHLDEDGAPRPIIHRDISPQNIMISYDGQVKLVDFGIAKAVTAYQEATRTGSLKGKFGYMAPEQIDTGSCTPQTDIFSVGVVLHEIITGRRLFKGQTDFDTMRKVKDAEIPLPSQVSASVAALAEKGGAMGRLDQTVLMALHRDPAQRYQRAGHMARDLDLVLQELGFTIEDMAAWLREVIPAGQREEAESQALPALGRGTSSRVGSALSPKATSGHRASPPESLGDMAGLLARTSDSVSRSYRSDPRRSQPLQSQAMAALPPPSVSAAPPPRPWRRLGVIALVALAFLATTGGVLLITFRMLRPSEPQVIALGPAQRTDPPKVPDKTPDKVPEKAPDKPEVVALPQARVRLDSDPSGARVYAGPRLLGDTPLDIALPNDELEVTLAMSGRAELRYTLRRADGPQVVLRLPKRRGSGRDGRLEASPGVPPAPEPVGTTSAPVTPPGPAKNPPQKRLTVPALDEEDGQRRGVRPVD